MATRGQNILTLSTVGTAALLLALLLANAVFARTNIRVDLTEDSLWTLAEGSEQVLGALEDPASIKVFWHDVPASGMSESIRRYLGDLLDEMRRAADGRLEVRWVDLEDEDGKAEADTLGVEPIPTQAYEGGQLTVSTEAYQTMVVEIGPEKVVIEPLDRRWRDVEYEVVSNLQRLTRRTQPVIGLWSPRPPMMNPFGGGPPPGNFRVLEAALEREFKTDFRSGLSLDEPIPPEVQVLIVVGPRDLEEAEVWNLEQFALRGGKTILLPDPVTIESAERFAMEPQRSGLEDWFAHLGVTVERKVVADYASSLKYLKEQQTRMGRMQTFVEHPLWPLLRGENMDQSVPALRRFDGLPLYWPAPLSHDAEKAKAAGRTVSVLATTTEYGVRENDIAASEGRRELREEEAEKVPLVLLVEGPLDSFWKGRETPAEKAAAEKKKEEEEAKRKEEEERRKAEEERRKEEPPKDGGGKSEGGTPEGETRKDEAPVGEGAEDEAPKDEAPAGESPKDEAPKDETPESEAPKEEAPGDEAPEAESPEEETPKEETPKEEAPAAPQEKPPRIDQGSVTILLIADAEFLSDYPAAEFEQGIRFLGQSQGYGRGFVFLGNLLGWMTGSDALMDLRARRDRPRNLEAVEAGEQKLIGLANTLAVPILLLFAGIVVFVVRRYQK
jgi:ABC-type uncharacterized transport system involved in gliding motility auxiliary subunit